MTERGRRIPLAGEAFDFVWWARIGYLSSKDSSVTVSAGTTSVGRACGADSTIST